MALDDIERTQVVRYPRTGTMFAVTVLLAGYWVEFKKSVDGKKVVLSRKGETRNSRAFNVSIPRVIYLKMYRRAICEFKPACPVGKPARLAEEPAKEGGLAKQETAPKPPPAKPEQGNLF